MAPPLVVYATEVEYKNHYEIYYCRTPIMSFEGIRIFFPKDQFKHAFYESSSKGSDDIFSEARSQRIEWIRETLENEKADLYEGWDKTFKTYNPGRRVSVVYENFVVVIGLSLNRKGVLKGNFITCYKADESIDSIRKSPQWTKEECLSHLKLIGR